MGQFQVAPQLYGADAVAVQRRALEEIIGLSQDVLDRLE
ncbi:hypothetical protein TOK_3608 [Pseudonocardia sp. N23]|nr:hypothetical protein TOK_3608 [Pseudonocardia sp. N23]